MYQFQQHPFWCFHPICKLQSTKNVTSTQQVMSSINKTSKNVFSNSTFPVTPIFSSTGLVVIILHKLCIFGFIDFIENFSCNVSMVYEPALFDLLWILVIYGFFFLNSHCTASAKPSNVSCQLSVTAVTSTTSLTLPCL